MFDNVFHDNEVWGMNVDNLQPRDVERDHDGYVPNNLASCSRFKAGLRISNLEKRRNNFCFSLTISNFNKSYTVTFSVKRLAHFKISK